MSEQTRQTLAKAFDLIEAGQPEAAQTLIKPLLAAQPDDPDVWWVYAHAVSDADMARSAIKTVLRLDPTYAEAADLLNELEQQSAIQQLTRVSEKEAQFPADFPPTLPDLPSLDNDDFDDIDFDLDDEEDEDTEQETVPRNRLLLPAVLGVVALLIIVAVALLTSRPSNNQITPTAPVVAGNSTNTPFVVAGVTAEATTATPIPTVEATEEITLELTSLPTETSTLETTQEATDSTLEATQETAMLEVTFELLALPSAEVRPSLEVTPTAEAEATESFSLETYQVALDGFTLAEAGVNFETTVLGNTLVANICTTAGPELRSTLPNIMDIIARQPASDEIEAFGTRLVNCETGSALLFIAVPASTAQSYALGSVSETDFHAAWKSF